MNEHTNAGAYQVIDWNLHYENAKSRTINNTNWVAMPNKQSGLGYRRMVKENLPAYAVFVAIVLACSSQCPIDDRGKRHERDGWLTDNGTPNGEPWDAMDISLKTGIDEAVIDQALPYLCSDKIKWLRHGTAKEEETSI